MKDYKKEWMEKAKVDYFAPFIQLWLACNSWYRAHYSEKERATDRDFINILKSDFSRRNHLFKNFVDAISSDDKKRSNALKTNLELLHYSLERANLQPEKLAMPCTFHSFLLDYSQKEQPKAYISIIKTPRINADKSVHKDDAEEVLQLDNIFISSDLQTVFPGLIELIYQIRNMVIHGHVKPEKDEHDVVKYCYFILADMIDM